MVTIGLFQAIRSVTIWSAVQIRSDRIVLIEFTIGTDLTWPLRSGSPIWYVQQRTDTFQYEYREPIRAAEIRYDIFYDRDQKRPPFKARLDPNGNIIVRLTMEFIVSLKLCRVIRPINFIHNHWWWQGLTGWRWWQRNLCSIANDDYVIREKAAPRPAITSDIPSSNIKRKEINRLLNRHAHPPPSQKRNEIANPNT